MPADRVWTVKDALDWTVAYLTDRGDEHPRRSTEWLLSAATGLSRVELYAFHDRPLAESERALLRESVRRRATGEPLQYVTGEVAFRHLVLKVRPGVLIPRPETEVLVDSVLSAVEEAIAVRGRARVADLCTGSGCVGLAIAQERDGAIVSASDLSPVAVATATDNAARLGLTERFSAGEGDLFSPLPATWRGEIDVVASNPPYIPSADVPDLPAEVAGFEPHLALDGGPDGLAVFRRILAESRQWLRPGGILAVELDERMARIAAEEAEEWYQGVRVVSDLTGRDRIVVAQSPERS